MLYSSLQAQCFDSVEEMRSFYLRASEKVGIDLAWDDDMAFLREQTYDDAKKWLRLQSLVVEGCIRKQSDVAMFSYLGPQPVCETWSPWLISLTAPGARSTSGALDMGA